MQKKYINPHNAIVQHLLYFVIKLSGITGGKTPSPSYLMSHPSISRGIPIPVRRMILRCFWRRKRESITTTAAGSCL